MFPAHQTPRPYRVVSESSGGNDAAPGLRDQQADGDGTSSESVRRPTHTLGVIHNLPATHKLEALTRAATETASGMEAAFAGTSCAPEPAISVVALTSSNTAKHLTWKLRVELMLPHLQRSGINVHTRRIPRNRRQRRRLFDSLRGFDIVWLHRHTAWPTETHRILKMARHLIFDIDDPVGFRSEGRSKLSISKWVRFRSVARSSSAVLAASDGLVELARAHNDRVFLVPLCADPDVHSMRVRHRPAAEPLRLLWLGNRSTFRYLQLFRPHLEAIGRAHPSAELHVVGHAAIQLDCLPVFNHQWSANSESNFLRRSHLGLVPMPDDRWTRAKASLKPLQYMANGLPFLGTRVGNLLKLADGGRNGILADSPDEWVAAVAAIQANEPLRLQMGANGVDYIRRYHTPQHLAERVEAVFRAVANSVGNRHANSRRP